MNYTVELQIEADNKSELSEKITAFSNINQLLSHEELIITVNQLKQKPQIISIVKEFANEDIENLSVLEIASKIPTIIKKLKQ